MANKKGTSTKINTGAQPALTSNEKLLKFIKENNLDFQVSVFQDSYVYVKGKGFLFFDKPQLIYRAKEKNG